MQQSHSYTFTFEPDYNFVGGNGYALEAREIDFNRRLSIYRDSDEW